MLTRYLVFSESHFCPCIGYGGSLHIVLPSPMESGLSHYQTAHFGFCGAFRCLDDQSIYRCL